MSILAVPALTNLSLAVTQQKQAFTSGGAFPGSDYTPFGYLDNPYHCWNRHRSGVLRSSPGIGFGYYFPAGPGGYFDFAKNEIYQAHLRLGFLINRRQFWMSEDFRPGQLTSPYHTKNLFTFAFEEQGTKVECTFLQVGENTLAAKVALLGTQSRAVQIMAALDCRLGGSAWWGRDGLAGNYDAANDSVWIRCFAAGQVFTLLSDIPSQSHFFATDESQIQPWFASPSKIEKGISYHPKPLFAGLLLTGEVRPGSGVEHTVVLARGENSALSYERARECLRQTPQQFAVKHAEDAAFWSHAPRLEGDWPKHWRHGWVYDFETLRMMVRRPVGIYKYPWDAMQIQAPRTVLAETSIDMWALSYADAETAKEVILGLFANAPSDNVPCSREDGEMNMVAADGSECGTSISWCYPFFCAASIWARTQDKRWLAKLYPLLARFMRWTLANRVDSEGFITGKCSWETGMDASRRFLIEQPTGGELIDFLRIVELQSATSHAAGILVQFAEVLNDVASREDWRKIQQVYAAKTQTLWKDDWFYDFDTRTGNLVTSVGRDLGQVAPILCGVAHDDQKQKMRPALQQFYADSMARHLPAAEDWQDGLHWSSLVLPYLESLWVTGELELVSRVIETIAERIYISMDRRELVRPPAEGKDAASAQKLGWPGVSCEVWGAEGAYGGEGYGWGAVLPAHLIRCVVGFRDPQQANELPLSPNLPNSLMIANKTYRVVNLPCGEARLDLGIHVLDSRRVRVEGAWSGSVRTVSVKDAAGTAVPIEARGSSWHFEATNHQHYLIRTALISES